MKKLNPILAVALAVFVILAIYSLFVSDYSYFSFSLLATAAICEALFFYSNKRNKFFSIIEMALFVILGISKLTKMADENFYIVFSIVTVIFYASSLFVVFRNKRINK